MGANHQGRHATITLQIAGDFSFTLLSGHKKNRLVAINGCPVVHVAQLQ